MRLTLSSQFFRPQNVVAFLRDEWGLLLVLAFAIIDRLAFLRWWRAFPGGDTYNFIIIAQEILKGSYPVAEKRLPFYPALIALAHVFGLDWEAAALVVAFAASLAALVLLYALGRTLGLSTVALAAALLPLQAVAPFLFQSVRGYADTLFVALALSSLLAIRELRTWRRAVLAGILLGATSLTRLEGWFFAPVALGIALLRRGPRPHALTAAVVAAACWVPFLLVSARVGRPFLPKEYFADAAATEFGVTSVRAFAANYASTWTSVGVDRLWGEPRRLLQDTTTPSLRAFPKRAISFLTDPKEVPSILLLLGLGYLVLRRRGPFLRLLVPFLAVAAPIAWWGVRQRFLIVLYPLVFLAMAAGAEVMLRGIRRLTHRTPYGKLTTATLSLALLGLATGPWRLHTVAEAREVNAKNWGRDYAYYQAIQAARRLPGVIAFEHRSSIVLALFGELDNRGRAVFAETHLDAPTSAEQWKTIQQWDVRYLVARGKGENVFPMLADEQFRRSLIEIQRFTHPQQRGGDDLAVIYEVRP